MPSTTKDEATKPKQATAKDRIDGLHQSMKNVRSALRTLDGQLKGMGNVIDKEVFERDDAIIANVNLNNENDALYAQMEEDRRVYMKHHDSLKEDQAELQSDKRRLDLENEALKVKVKSLEGNKTAREEFQKQVKEKNVKIETLEGKLKVATTELEHLKGVERKFILELDKNAEKDQTIKQLKEDAKVHKLKLEDMRELKEQLHEKTQEHGGFLSWANALCARMTELRTSNAALESSKKEALSKAEKHAELEKEVLWLRAELTDLKGKANCQQIQQKAVIEENESLKLKIQELEEASRHGATPEQVNHLTEKAQDLEKDRKLKEPLTMLGSSIRMAYMRFEAGGTNDHAIMPQIVDAIAYSKNPQVDAALYQTGTLSVEADGHLFKEIYSSPAFVQLDYAAMPKYCEMLENLDIVADWLPETHRSRDMPEWARRKQVIEELKGMWNEAIMKDVMEFEGREDVGKLVDELVELSDRLGEAKTASDEFWEGC
ncbi:hypothetical protein ONS95_009588 [Cadophora gregata]|uniref:uncharacterized protein n=1 Tax=Cadophora gregata TaxID=51156 RepID=UPI0026DD4EA5|nr:uncharacterized protein ONS95_009588 [Cadophora gregata]KAK0124641.1 hypothetical protein ONS95_009588 [Cadophora gregata]KAK0129501.1 hypothetical protein ONS96_000067 [Cadophora gregata f. sp. sojae]